MTCLICGGPMERKVIEIHQAAPLEGRSLHYIVSDVPAGVCRHCGETTYETGVVEKLHAITKAVQSGKRAPKTIVVPVYSLVNLRD